jgi:hypothetical protein
MAVVIIRPQAEVEDEDELPVAFPARGSFEIADLTSAATGFDSEPVNTSGQEVVAGVSFV